MIPKIHKMTMNTQVKGCVRVISVKYTEKPIKVVQISNQEYQNVIDSLTGKELHNIVKSCKENYTNLQFKKNSEAQITP